MEKISYLYVVKREIYNNIKQTIMRITNQKALDYLNSNPIVANFINQVNISRKDDYIKADMHSQWKELTVEIGNKFIKIWSSNYCWGFISRVDGDLKGSPIKKGDLLRAATWKAPAKHARGNIIDGTARYGTYGPEYL